MSHVKSFALEIEAAAGGEDIVAIVIGDGPGDRVAHALIGRILSWDEAREALDYSYDDGFGGADCHAVYAWTENRIIGVHEYDGSTNVTWVPRNPGGTKPDYL